MGDALGGRTQRRHLDLWAAIAGGQVDAGKVVVLVAVLADATPCNE